MAQPVELIPLLCIRCSQPIPAEPSEVAWACKPCGQGMQLDESQGVIPLDIHYAAGIAPGATGRPFWVAQGQVAVQRATYSGNQDREAQTFWSQPRPFVIPAFDCPLDAMLKLGAGFLFQPPTLQPGSPAPFAPVTLSVRDVHALAEFIVVATEAGRKDQVKEVRVDLKLSEPALWILP